MNEQTTIPIEWFFAMIGLLVPLGGYFFVAWLKSEWKRNWEEHAEIDSRIDHHHDKIDKHLDRIHNRIDWILQHGGYPKYPEERDADASHPSGAR